jgi:hypothetical protein
MSLGGRVFEHHTDDDVELCCAMRIPLSSSDYVNFKYPAGATVRHAVAVTSIVAILQRSVAARPDVLSPADFPIPAELPFPAPLVRSWGPH